MSFITRSFFYTGTIQTFTVPNNVTSITLQAWGAGGAGGTNAGVGSTLACGGGGGYASGVLSISQPTTLSITVGGAGLASNTVSAFGGGGRGGSGASYTGSGGGGLSGIFNNTIPILIAGAGGGSVYSTGGAIGSGGGGGGESGGNGVFTGTDPAYIAGGGTQTSGGIHTTNYDNEPNQFVTPTNGGKYTGGNGGSTPYNPFGGAGGGSGYYGGGGTSIVGAATSGGGGGSSYLSPILTNTITIGSINSTTITANTIPGGINQPNYTSDYGYGGTASDSGRNGYVVITYFVPEIIATKTVNKSYSNVNSTLTYTLSINNISGGTLNNIVIIDTVPTGTTFVSNSLKVNGTTVLGTLAPPTGYTLTTLPIGVYTLTFNVLVNSTLPSPNPISNIATAGYAGGNIYNSNAIYTTIVAAVLSSSKSVDKAFADVGSVLTFTIPITNTGNITANNIVFIDTIPSNTTFLANSLKQDGTTIVGSSNPPGVTLPRGISVNTTSTITFQILINSIPSPNPILNSALAIFSYTVDSSTTPNTVSSNNVTYTNITTTTVVNAVLSSSKLVDLNYAKVGDILTYSIHLSNLGNTTANIIVLLDTIPNNTTLVANSFKQDGTIVTSSPNSPGATLPNGIGVGKVSTVTFQVLVTTIPSPNLITNSASTTFYFTVDPSIINGGFGSSNTNVVATTLVNATLQSSKVVNKNYADIGNILTFTIPLINTGTTTANNIVFIDTIPTNTAFIANSLKQDGTTVVGSPNPPGIALPKGIFANTTSTLTFQVIVTAIASPNPIRNSALAIFSFTVDSSTTPNTVSSNNITYTNITTTTVINSFLQSSKQVNTDYATVGDILTYTIPLSNLGNTTANNVVFIDTIPNNTTLVVNSFKIDGTTITGTPNPPGYTLPNGIAAGNVSTVTFQVLINTIPSPNPITNSASTRFSYTVDPSVINGASGSTNTNIITTQVNNANLVNITKFVDKSFADCGDLLTYTIILPNSGNITAVNVVLFDTIPNGTVFQNNSVTVNGVTIANSNPINGITIPSIGAGLSATITFRVMVQC